jgi:hypothetical protein
LVSWLPCYPFAVPWPQLSPESLVTSGFDRATVFRGPPEEFVVGCVREGSIFVTDEIAAQEVQKILLMALECLNSGKINKATTDRISDAANLPQARFGQHGSTSPQANGINSKSHRP